VARIRTIKPQFFLNEDVAALPYEWRLLFIGLWTQADRSGRLEDRPQRLKAALFPYDDLDVNDGLGCLTNAGLITRYDGNGQRLIAIPKWAKHQQPNTKEALSEFPPPEGTENTVPAPCQHNRKGREGNGDQEGNGTDARARFERFWADYPRKEGKTAAWSVWERLKPSDELLAVMLDKVREHATSQQWRADGGRFIPHPKTWLNQGRWEDEGTILDAIEQTPADTRAWLAEVKFCNHQPLCAHPGEGACAEMFMMAEEQRRSA
jgi:hypothetical protein